MTPQVTGWIDRKCYPNYGTNWDDSLFRARVMQSIRPEHRLLDLGAGAGIVEQMDFRGCVTRVTGVDLDPRVVTNPYLDEGIVVDGDDLPFSDGAFDVVIADNVLEHLDEPHQVFREVHRVLRAGGVFLAKTPNRWHYMPLVARCTPHSFHRRINAKRGRKDVDTFPTYYRANSMRQLTALGRLAGFACVTIEQVEGRPEYMRLHPFLYALGMLYERIVNSAPVFSPFRILLIATFQKA